MGTNEWDSIIPNLTSGNYDTNHAGMSINPSAKKVIDFTQKTTSRQRPPASCLRNRLMPTSAGGVVFPHKPATIKRVHVAESGGHFAEFLPTYERNRRSRDNGEARRGFRR